jgi:diguanylate cyclase (GGDEF)-like protein/PAS domain S-box-containing protein
MVIKNSDFKDSKIPEIIKISELKSKNSSDKILINALINNMPDAIYFKDKKSRFVLINKSCANKFFLKTPEEAIGKTDFDYFSEEHANQAYNDEKYIIKTGKPIINIEEKETWSDNKVSWGSTTKMPLFDKKERIIGTFGITRDITDKKKAEEKIEFLTFHDKLTGLYNRAYFEEEIKRLDTERQLPISIIMGDINGLKNINDNFGHDVGDKLLRKVALILKESFRSEDIIARWGGDEFLGILTKTSRKDALIIVKRIRERCKTECTSEVPISISIGVSTKKNSYEDLENVIKKADSEMYKNKLTDTNNLFASASYSEKEGKEMNYYSTTDN